MRIGVVMMVVAMVMTMIVTVVMVMAVGPCPNALNMMVMGFLDHADLILKTQDSFTILAV